MKTTIFIKNLAFIFLLIHLFSSCQEQKTTNTSDTVRYKKREIPSIVEEKKNISYRRTNAQTRTDKYS